jgi:uncharacterized membrane protein
MASFTRIRIFAPAAALLLLSGVAAAQPTVANYQAIPVGLLPGAFSNVAWGVNNAGHVVGWNQGPQTLLRAYIWRPSTGITEIPTPAGFTDSRADDISNTGFVAGSSNNGGASDSTAWRWRDGVYTFIPRIPGQCMSMMAIAVNDQGDVVGTTCDGSFGAVPFYYSDATGTINLQPFGISNVRDINNAGVVTGSAFDGTKYVAMRWQAPAGPMEFLPTLPAPYDDASRGEGLNEAGQVVGVSINVLTGSDSWRAFEGTPAGVQMISSPVTARSSAYAINELGEAVGTDGTSSTTDIYAWRWTQAEGKEFLAGTVNNVDVWTVNRAIDVNDHGHIIGSISAPEVPGRAVILHRIGTPPPGGGVCYANCDGSTASPVLNVADFTCFLQRFAAGESYANCDQSTSAPVLNVADFTCFLQSFAAGCP